MNSAHQTLINFLRERHVFSHHARHIESLDAWEMVLKDSTGVVVKAFSPSYEGACREITTKMRERHLLP